MSNITAPNKTYAPWTAEEVSSLNAFQHSPSVHSFTCACDTDEPLVATPDGWICPAGCPRVQNWAWEWMTNRAWEAVVKVLERKAPLNTHPLAVENFVQGVLEGRPEET